MSVKDGCLLKEGTFSNAGEPNWLSKLGALVIGLDKALLLLGTLGNAGVNDSSAGLKLDCEKDDLTLGNLGCVALSGAEGTVADTVAVEPSDVGEVVPKKELPIPGLFPRRLCLVTNEL